MFHFSRIGKTAGQIKPWSYQSMYWTKSNLSWMPASAVSYLSLPFTLGCFHKENIDLLKISCRKYLGRHFHDYPCVKLRIGESLDDCIACNRGFTVKPVLSCIVRNLTGEFEEWGVRVRAGEYSPKYRVTFMLPVRPPFSCLLFSSIRPKFEGFHVSESLLFTFFFVEVFSS